VGETQPAAGQVPAASAVTARRFRLASPAIWVIVLGGLAALSLAPMIPLSFLAHQVFNGVVPLVIGVPCAAVGVLVARRQPHNPIGWLFLVIAIGLFLGTDGGDYGYLGYRLGHHLPLASAGVVLEQVWGPGLYLLFVVMLLFPDGRLPSRFWRWALGAYCALYAALLVALAVATAGAMIGHAIRVDATGGLSATDNPVGWYKTVLHGMDIALLVLSVSFIGRQVLSWRRSSGDRRQQLKWLATGAAVTLASVVIAVPFSSAGAPTTLLQWVGGLAWFGVAALPVSIGVAILKYRLYDIDRIISRSLAYAIVTSLLIGLYAGVVLLATRVLPFHTPVAVAGATLLAAALFNPLRRRVQRAVDRRFNRARYNADKTMAAFAARLQDALALDSIQDDLAGVVHQALEPAHVSVWISQRD
jgi:hypothetical protein